MKKSLKSQLFDLIASEPNQTAHLRRITELYSNLKFADYNSKHPYNPIHYTSLAVAPQFTTPTSTEPRYLTKTAPNTYTLTR